MVSNIKKFGGGGSYIVGNSAKAYYAAAGKIDYFTKRGYLAKNSWPLFLMFNINFHSSMYR
jgi:hypothetical protein